MNTLCKTQTETHGEVRVEQWPEGLVLWVGGEIQWRSWTTVDPYRPLTHRYDPAAASVARMEPCT